MQTSNRSPVPRREGEQERKDEENDHQEEFAYLFATNDAPTSLQQSQLRASLQALLKKTKEFADTLVTSERRVKAHDRERLLDQVSRHKAALAPIRNLPKDMLQEILRTFAADQPTEAEELDSLNLKKGIWPLGQVCSSWRQAIHGMPRLWSRIVIKPNPTLHSPSILSSIIERSKCVPLDVSFESEIDEEVSRNLLQQLCTQSHRWRSLRLFIPYSQASWLSTVKNSVPNLTMLHYSLFGPGVSTEDSTFENAPKLREVELGDWKGSADMPHLKLPPNTVSKLTLKSTGPPLLPIQGIIPPSVLDLSLDIHVHRLSPTRLLLPHVQVLRISHTFLRAIECPDIDMLTVYGPICQELCDGLDAFVAHSGDFTCMTLQPIYYSSDSLKGVLDRLDFIEILEIEDLMCCDRYDFLFIVKKFLRLMVVKDGQHLLPSLTYFGLSFFEHRADTALLKLAYEVATTRDLFEFHFLDPSIQTLIDIDTIDELLTLEAEDSYEDEEEE